MITRMIEKAREFSEMLASSERRRVERLKQARDRAASSMALRYFCTDETPEVMPHERAAFEAWDEYQRTTHSAGGE